MSARHEEEEPSELIWRERKARSGSSEAEKKGDVRRRTCVRMWEERLMGDRGQRAILGS